MSRKRHFKQTRYGLIPLREEAVAAWELLTEAMPSAEDALVSEALSVGLIVLGLAQQSLADILGVTISREPEWWARKQAQARGTDSPSNHK